MGNARWIRKFLGLSTKVMIGLLLISDRLDVFKFFQDE